MTRAFVVAGVVACVGSGLAQTLSIQSDVVQPAQPDSIVQIAAESQGLVQLAPADLPIMGGTFWWVMPGGAAVPAPCAPLDLSGAIFQISEGQFLVDQTGGQVVANTSRFGLQAQATSSTVASEVASQVDAVVNLITQVQTTAANQQMRATMQAMGMDVPSPGDAGSDGGTNVYTFNGSSYAVDFGTNLYIAQVAIQLGNLVGIISNSVADIPYQILSCQNLAPAANWVPEGALVYGSENTNWTPFSVAMNNRQNLFIRILSWQDSTGSGIPDWWWLKYFGQITNVDAYADPMNDGWSNLQKFQLGLSPTNFYTPPAPTGVYAYLDSTGTNVVVSWNPSPGPVTNYIILGGIWDWNTYSYDYQQIGTVNGGTNSFTVVGAVQNNNYLYDVFDVQAVYPGGTSALSGDAYINSGPQSSSSFTYNVYITAYLVRNATGRWQVMFSGFPTNSAQAIQLTWTDGNGNATLQSISTTNLINGIYPIADTDAVNLLGNSLSVQLFGPNGEPGQVAQAGVLANDAPYFVDGRQHLKQNLNFLIRAASQYLPYAAYGQYSYYLFDWFAFTSSTNFEEFSFLHPDSGFAALDNLWPFEMNYSLANYLVDTSRTNSYNSPFGDTNFNFVANFATNIPAPPILGNVAPYWILQFGLYWDAYNSADPYNNTSDWGVTISSTNTVASLQSGLHNLFGLAYGTGCMVDMSYVSPVTGGYELPPIYQPLGLGDTITAMYALTDGYDFKAYASQCPAPTLQLANYFFAPLNNPNLNTTNLPPVEQQPFVTPLVDNFNVTNQTPPVMVGSVGQPMILGSWAKYSIQGSSPTKYAYLGQYFVTNVFLLNTNGTATTNSAGILSPYGEFFPTQAGLAALMTMPDIDPPYEQGTGVVRVISLNADANHDGTLDFSYFGPDQTSPSRPLHFWINDNQDRGDDWGTGIPDQTGLSSDGLIFTGQDANGNLTYNIHGRRDLADFFPVYLNIGSLFQSNVLSSGINPSDPNYHFRLSQADGALRFAYTDLTPTNFMDYLRNTNEALALQYAPLTTIPAEGVDLTNTFLSAIATAGQGIILVEAWTNTTQPLMLQIFNGTNLIAQTQLYLSISEVEQMFRHKGLLLNTAGEVDLPADRLNDWDVPNEPDTINKNFIFLHGYNVSPNQARGVAADMFKRMYWSGSHAKFYAVTWQGDDSQNAIVADVTGNFHTNVVHAFNTAPLLNSFLNSLSGTNIVAAHSLGNMVVLSTLNDYTNEMINTYFMLDAAVPMEALDGSTDSSTNVIHSDWRGYTNRLWASDWYLLFPGNDGRSQLSWNNRLANLQNAVVYNFYSSGEEVLRTYTNATTPSLSGMAAGQIFQNLWNGVPVASYTWCYQELLKGRCPFEDVLGSMHGGWLFNPSYNDGFGNHMSNSIAASLPNSELQTNAFFNFMNNDFTSHPDVALQGVNGSSYAQAHRNRILSDAIPAITLPTGANPVPRFQASDRNIDMQTLENGWPYDRLINSEKNNNWHHSDFHEVAYTFTYQVFNQIVSLGNLK